MNRIQSAVDMFRNGCACSQAILAAFGPDHGLDATQALKVSAGFAGGMRLAETCGAVTGAFMVLGLHAAGDDCDTGPGRGRVYDLVREFASLFQEKNGSISCRDLLGCNISTPDGMQAARDQDLFKTKCPQMVQDAAEILEQLLQKD